MSKSQYLFRFKIFCSTNATPLHSPSYYIHVDINPTSPTYGTVQSQGTVPRPQYFFADWAYVPGAGPYLWGVGVDRTLGVAWLYRFDQTNLALDLIGNYGVIDIPTNQALVNFGAVYSSIDGFLYGVENFSGNIFRFTVTPGNLVAELISTAPRTEQNGGARCIDNAEPIETP